MIQSLTRCKNLFQNLILFKILHSKTVYYPFFSISWFMRKQITTEVGVLRDKKFQKRFSASKTFIKICFFTIQIHFEIWSVVKLVCSKSDTFQNYGFESCRVVKTGSKSDAFESFDSKYEELYKKMIQKLIFFRKFWSKCFLSIKRTFSGRTLARKHKKARFDAFTVKIDQINNSLRSSFPTLIF